MTPGTERYYDQRASEYDRVYEKPERRQSELAFVSRFKKSLKTRKRFAKGSRHHSRR